MTTIISPLKLGMRGAAIADLHAAIETLVGAGTFPLSAQDQRLVTERLQEERRAQTFGGTTQILVRLFQKHAKLEPSGEIDKNTAEALNALLAASAPRAPATPPTPPSVPEREEPVPSKPADPAAGTHFVYSVNGTVSFPDGIAARNIAVAAFDRDLRREQLLGRAITDARGQYAIEYTDDAFLRAERGSADLVVRATAAGGAVLVESPILFNAPLTSTIDLMIAAGQPSQSLIERLDAVVMPLLDDVKFEDLEEDANHRDFTFLAGETGFAKADLVRLALATRLAVQTLPREFWFALLPGSTFAYAETRSLAEQLLTARTATAGMDETAVRKALRSAFNRNDIPVSLDKSVDAWIAAFVALGAERVLGTQDAPSFAARAIADAKIKKPENQKKIAELINRHGTLNRAAVDALEQDKSFGANEIADLRTSYRLADLTGGDFVLVKAIKDGFGVHEPQQVRELAKRTEAEWTALIARNQAAGARLPLDIPALAKGVAAPDAAVNAKLLKQRFADAYPTAAFSGGLDRALKNGGARGIKQASSLKAFLDQHSDFELQRTPVDSYLANQVRPEFRKTASQPAFRTELKAVQRVAKLAPSFEAADAALAEGHHSAQSIYRMGRAEFVKTHANKNGVTAQDAEVMWDRAADTHAAALTIVAEMQALDSGGMPAAIQSGGANALKNFPNWNNLFQTGDLCACEECRSVLGPAAYFADLLMFLGDRQTKDPPVGVTAKDVLFKRRPDLGYLELNCENALTPYPYVDGACEVLEAAVSKGANDRKLVNFTAIPANSAAAQVAVRSALGAAQLDVGADITLSQVDPLNPDLWVVHGEAATYLLKKKGGAEFYAAILPNTKASADELRAYPAYVDAAAYETLRQTGYPFTLPFDLYAEETRAGFQKSNLARWDLMETLHASAPSTPAADDIAAEYFGISCDPGAPTLDEKRLILVTKPTDPLQQGVWGEGGNATWKAKVANVKTFLFKTGLEYTQLLALLDLKWVNSGNVTIHHLDASCDTDKKELVGLDAASLDRIHRFLRLWRRLPGWTMWELDLVIRHPRIGNGLLDSQFLIRLFYFCRVKTRLGAKASVEQVCALFGNLNTETQFTELYKPRSNGLYQNLFLNKRLIRPPDQAFEVTKVDVLAPTAETIPLHLPVVLAALTIGEADLTTLRGLTRPSDGLPYIGNDLTLTNLSFLWRHTWLTKQLRRKIPDWSRLLPLIKPQVTLLTDPNPNKPFEFVDPKAAHDFLDLIEQLALCGFTPDELSWLLAADTTAKAAVTDATAARALLALRKDLKDVEAQYDPAQYPFLNPPSDTGSLVPLLTSLLLQLHRDEAAAQVFVDMLSDTAVIELDVPGLPAAFVDFPAFTPAIPISYDAATARMRFTGLMTAVQKAKLLTDPSLAVVNGNANYQAAVNEFFDRARLALKFLEPVFRAPLADLPAFVDFASLSDPLLAKKISYDAEERNLVVEGVLSAADKSALDALSADQLYQNAVNSLFTKPVLGPFAPDEIWLTDPDLIFPLSSNLDANLATAIQKALPYLLKMQSTGTVVREVGAQLGLTDGLARHLVSTYALPLLPGTLLAYLTGPFAATTGVINPTALKAWYWAARAAALLKKWKATLEDWERIDGIVANARLLDLAKLPLDGTGTPPTDEMLRTSRLFRFRATLPETKIGFLEVLEKLNTAGYTAATFAADAESMNDAWNAADVAALTATLDVFYPAGYMLVEAWERLRRAFYFLDSLNAHVATAAKFAAITMNAACAGTLKDLLRAKFGTETWLSLSAEIQDVLRERKRSALATYLLTQPMPLDAPSKKWENTNDLYAYYLLDVEMCSCQLTSRLVQGSGSIQLFVQRCFMGLEPDVTVKADGDTGDTAWHWWTWMSKYRVWQANRQVFLWPENWIEPELKKDRSSFFKDLENELHQNDVTKESAETALANYLEKLDGVAQLEIAGFYQEDKGTDAIVHVFGRTGGTDPHMYYYRRFDFRQWTPWEKVDLDIQGDYLVPAVVGDRLFVFWPVFTEKADEQSNSSVNVPTQGQANAPLQPAVKKLRVQLAVSDYRQGKWTPKRISTDYAETSSFIGEIARDGYRFVAIDRSDIDGRFGVRCSGFSRYLSSKPPGQQTAVLSAVFEIAGCKGVPILVTDMPGSFAPFLRAEPASTGGETSFMRWLELPLQIRADRPDRDFSLQSKVGNAIIELLHDTQWQFQMTPPWHLSYMDKMQLDANFGFQWLADGGAGGSWLPFFYNDRKREFFVLPVLAGAEVTGRDPTAIPGHVWNHYPEIKKAFRDLEAQFSVMIRAWVDSLNLPQMSAADRAASEAVVFQLFPQEHAPPYTDEELINLVVRFFMRYVHFYLAWFSILLFQNRQFEFRNFYHPFVCHFAKLLHNPLQGVPALMRRETQFSDSGFSFKQMFQPTTSVIDPANDTHYPREIVDFSPDGAYSPYNWELFFHVPLLIANSLSRNQRFEEARDWYHYIFNPLGVESSIAGGSTMSKYWITKPFFETTDPQYIQQRIDNIMAMLAGDTTVPGYSTAANDALDAQVKDWRDYPFEPHRIANYRTVAYQKTVVMKYLDNLIAWGDYLFRQDSMESINQATQLYIMAAEILGPRPKKMPPQVKPPLESFNELEAKLDTFSNALVEVENLVPPMPGNSQGGSSGPPLPTLYFCIPYNTKMVGYWDTVADRLYKIRHCMNIEGVVRQLALFEPPIDPGALVKAIAGGADLASALADLNVPLPFYRFNVMLQKANEVCNDVKALGSALLAALEKKDAEALSLLRQSHEIRVQEAVKTVRQKQIDEAKENLVGVKRGRALAESKQTYYTGREFMIAGEKTAVGLNTASTSIDAGIAAGYTLAGGLKLIPQFLLGASGFGGTPHATAETGGKAFGDSAEDLVRTLESISRALDKAASLVDKMASYRRRQDDWDFQAELAAKEIAQIDSQIASAELRVALAEKELENQVMQIENSHAVDDFMRSKYTNQDLYQWQIGQVASVYFRSYKLAYDLAKRAERCFRFELALTDSSYINFGYWDSLKKGLLAGENLQFDLRRLESAYLEKNRRDLELTKHVSIALTDPRALVRLIETGRCYVDLNEELFDLDYPGHYARRIKSVSMTIPGVTGPHTTIACTLRLLKNSVRVDTTNGDDGYPRNNDDGAPLDDPRFVESNIPIRAMATSSGQNDSGMFELNFRDERYLPFEGAGVISTWAIELFHDLPSNNPDPANPDFGAPLRQFDYRTISDVVLHIKYTAREDAGPFKNNAVGHLRDHFTAADATPLWRAFNLRRDFPSQWARFLNPTNPADPNVFELPMTPDLFRMLDAGKSLKVNAIEVLARCTASGAYGVVLAPPLTTPSNTMTLAVKQEFGGLHHDRKDVAVDIVPTDPIVTWKLTMTKPGGGKLQLDPTTQEMEVGDVVLVLGYEWS